MRIDLFAAPCPTGVTQPVPVESKRGAAAALGAPYEPFQRRTAPAAAGTCPARPLPDPGTLPADLARLVTATDWIERVAFARRRLRPGPHEGWWCATLRPTAVLSESVAAAHRLGYPDASPRVPWSVWLRRATPAEWLEQR